MVLQVNTCRTSTLQFCSHRIGEWLNAYVLSHSMKIYKSFGIHSNACVCVCVHACVCVCVCAQLVSVPFNAGYALKVKSQLVQFI